MLKGVDIVTCTFVIIKINYIYKSYNENEKKECNFKSI